MTDPTIRAALEKTQRAVSAALAASPCIYAGGGCEHRPCRCEGAATANGITTFLNAPPPPAQTIRLYLGEVSPQGLRDIYAYHRWLAAAVEQAAKEAVE
jgi:hypothetical protein